jgi:hypothetical protein
LGYRDLRASLAQFNLVPVDAEADRQAQIEQFIEDSVRLTGLDGFGFGSPFQDAAEEWTVVYDKFQVHRR